MKSCSLSVERAVASAVARHGYTVLRGEQPDLPEHCYSVGMTVRYGRPELVLFGVPAGDAVDIMHAIALRYARGAEFRDGAVFDDLPAPLAFKYVSTEAARPFAPYAFAYCRHHLVMPWFQQVVMPDSLGRFPWDAGFVDGAAQTRLWLDPGAAPMARVPSALLAARRQEQAPAAVRLLG